MASVEQAVWENRVLIDSLEKVVRADGRFAYAILLGLLFIGALLWYGVRRVEKRLDALEARLAAKPDAT